MSRAFRRSLHLLPLFVVFAAVAAMLSGCISLAPLKSQYGPSGPAQVTGKLTSDRGAILANATVTLSGATAKRRTTTDINGKFVFENVPLGQYKVTGSCPGYKSSSAQLNVDKESGNEVALQLKM